MTGSDLTLIGDQDRIREPEPTQARRDLVDLLLGMSAGVSGHSPENLLRSLL
jgi:hypothetical protein